MHWQTLLALVSTTLLLTACGKAVPPEKMAFVGDWRGPAMTLSITQDGQVAYERHKGGVNTSINAPLKGFSGDNFEVGLGPISTVFVVNVPPHQSRDKWYMTVDGVELTRTP